MKLIVKYWKQFIAGLVGIFVISKVIINRINSSRLKKTDEQLKTNNSSIDKLSGKIERISEEKQVIQDSIQENMNQLEELDTAKTQIKHEPRTTNEHKQNILNKTRR